MAKEKKYLIYTNDRDDGVFGTLVDLIRFMIRNNIPDKAELVYAGCGSHSIAFRWEEEIIEEGLQL